MNPSWVKTQADRNKVYREYMASLKLEEQNIEKTASALKTKDLTGQVPSRPTDTRTTSEKYMDIYRLRNELESGLSDIMSPDEAAKVVSQLDEDEIQFGRTQLQAIIKDLKPRFELGVPSAVFINYLRKLLEKFIITEGVENAVGQSAGGAPPSGALFTSFNDITQARTNLQNLQDAISRAYSQLNEASARDALASSRVRASPNAPNAPNAPIPSESMALVPYNRLNAEIQSLLFLIPTADELRQISQISNANHRSIMYEALTDIERFLPDSNLINRTISDLTRAQQRNDINEINDILQDIYNYINFPQEQKDALKQIKDSIISEGEEEMGPVSSRAGGRRVEITERKVSVRIPKKPKQSQESLEDSPIKTFRNADKELSEVDNKKLDSVEYKPITRDAFIKLSQAKKEGYIAKALMQGDIPQGSYGLINERDENGNFYKTILTPKLVLTNIREGSGEGQKRRPRHTSTQLIGIFDRYLEFKTITEEPIEEISGTPSKNSSSMSAVSGTTPAGVASLFTPQGEKEKKGKGIRGRGLAPQRRNRVEGRIEREPEPRSAYSFAPFGRYIINTNKLQKCILSINTKTGKSLSNLKSKLITKKLTEIFKEIAKGKEINNEMTDGLTDEEIDILYNTLNECHLLSKYNTPTSQALSKSEKEIQRFMILKGQIQAGQNNEAVVREFKALLLKYMKKGQIPKSEGYEILQELLVLGY
jgi:hypothetical protein